MDPRAAVEEEKGPRKEHVLPFLASENLKEKKNEEEKEQVNQIVQHKFKQCLC